MIAPIGQVSATPTSSAGGLGALDSDAFLKLLVAQMRYQNPMAPSDPTSMLQQTAQFTQIETLNRLAALQNHLLQLQNTVFSTDLVGKFVHVRSGDGSVIEGTVDAVRFTESGPMLVLGETEVPFDSALEIRHSPSTA